MIYPNVLVVIFFSIHHHYRGLAKGLSLNNFSPIAHQDARHRVIVPISGVHQGTLAALDYARKLSHDITAIHAAVEPTESDMVGRKWETWGEGVRLVVVNSPYRLFLELLLDYIAEILNQRQPGATLNIIVPEFISNNWFASALDTNTAGL